MLPLCCDCSVHTPFAHSFNLSSSQQCVFYCYILFFNVFEYTTLTILAVVDILVAALALWC